MSKQKRVLIKLSGAAFKEDNLNISTNKITAYAKQIHELVKQGFQISIVIGGGNIWRGESGSKLGMDRAQGDYMGMLATIMNSLALQAVLEKMGCESRVQTSLDMPKVAEPYIKRKAKRHLEKGRVVIFGGGTGNPFFTTDTAAALRATEIGVDALLVAKNGVDGVYDKDPAQHKDAKMFDKLTFKEVINKELRVMDMTSMTMCWENDVNIVVFNIDKPNALIEAATGKGKCTTITN